MHFKWIKEYSNIFLSLAYPTLSYFLSFKLVYMVDGSKKLGYQSETTPNGL